MNILCKPINGNEVCDDPFAPTAALSRFYSAFNQGNYQKMKQNWLLTELASMSNPLGGVKRGWDEISEMYKKIFNGPATVYVEFYDYSICHSGDMIIAVGRERGMFETNDTKIDLQIRTSRVFILDQGQWKQLHHHGSIEDPELLKEYQTAVTNSLL